MNHRWSHSSPEKYVNVLYVTYWPAGSLCNIGLEVLLKGVCFIQQRTIMNTLGGFHKGSESPMLDWCNVWKKKNVIKNVWVFVSFIG